VATALATSRYVAGPRGLPTRLEPSRALKVVAPGAICAPVRRLQIFAAVASIGLSIALVPGCGGLPRAPATPSAQDGFAPVAPPPGMDDTAPAGLMLFPGDRVTLRMQSAEVSEVGPLVVDERGVIHVPLAGDIEVGGTPLTQAEHRIEQGMRQYDATVRVTILMSDATGHMASVIGAVENQGRFAVVPGMRVADLLAAAGGPLPGGDPSAPAADLAAARVIRGGQGLPISVALALSGDLRHNVRVRPGDHLYVPAQRGNMVTVIGEVNGGLVFPHRDGIRLSQALGLAGGMTRDANGGDIRIVRGPSSNPTVYRAAMDHIANGEHPDPVLAPGDIVLVGSSALADFRDVMAAIAPVLTAASTTTVGVAAVTAASP